MVKGRIEIAEKLRATLVRHVPKRVAADAERHFKESFRNQGFTDKQLKPWPRLKVARSNSKGQELKDRILKDTGLLSNSIRVARADINGIQVVAGGPHVPYAQIHNEGGRIRGTQNVRAHKRRSRKTGKEHDVRAFTRNVDITIPPRPFMGPSEILERKMRATVLKSIIQAIR